MTTLKTLLLAATAACAAIATPALAADPVTYTSTGSADDTIHGVTVSYTITTNGNLGALSLNDIVGSTFTFKGASSGEFSFDTFTAQNSLYYYPDTYLYATSDGALKFDFAGGGGLNAGTQNCSAINVCDGAQSSGTSNVAQGLVYALAGIQSTDDDSVMFHPSGSLPDRELDSFADSGNPNGENYNLRDGFYNTVQARLTTIATAAPASAVPEPATWAMMILGMGAIGYAMRRRQSVRVSYAA